jgi:hypothetical protein
MEQLMQEIERVCNEAQLPLWEIQTVLGNCLASTFTHDIHSSGIILHTLAEYYADVAGLIAAPPAGSA